MNVYEKLQKARVELQNFNLKKTGKNKYSGFEYFNLGDFLPKVNELLEKNKLFSCFSIIEGRAILKIIDTEKENSCIDFESPIEELELKGCNKIQALGGVHTYLKRYLYMNAFEIVENDIFDILNGKAKTEKAKTEKKDEKEEKGDFITPQEKTKLREKIGPHAYTVEFNKVGGKITQARYNELMGVENGR